MSTQYRGLNRRVDRRPFHAGRRGWILGCLVIALGAWGASPAASASGAEPRLQGFFDTWRQAAGLWMTEAEQSLFDSLDDPLERELFLHAFWAQRRPAEDAVSAGDSLENPLAEAFGLRLDEALARFERLDDARARALLLAGKPLTITYLGACADVLRALEVWAYMDGSFLLFYRRGSEMVHWAPHEGAGALMFGDSSRWTSQQVVEFFDQRGCWRSRHGAAVDLQAALDDALDLETLAQRSVVSPLDRQWPEAFRARLDAGELRLPIPRVALTTPGRYQQKTILQGRFEIPSAAVGRNAEGHLFDRLVMIGDVWWGERPGGRLVDSFRIIHYVAGASTEAHSFPLSLYRRLRPGTYTVDVRLEDRRGLALARHREVVAVPRLTDEAPPPPGYGKGFAGLTRSEVGVLTTFPGVEVLSPGERLLVGDIWLEAVTTGGPIERVDFFLDGRHVASDTQSPYAAKVDFGSEPRPHDVRAVAYDPAGRPLVEDVRRLEVAASRFAVHLLEPVRGTSGPKARVMVQLPPTKILQSVELFLGERFYRRLEGPSFEAPLPDEIALNDWRDGGPRSPLYLRAVATLDDGEQAEDVVWIDARAPIDAIDVQRVELYATVLDGRGRPVTGLSEDDFKVFDDTVEQDLLRFDTVENLAINVALLMDVSSSMRRQLELASRSARGFFETVLTPKDQASLLIFNDDIRQVVPFTSDVERLLREATGFRAWGTTRLHDSLMFTVHSFGGLSGKRALVLLSDGQDVDSDFPFRQVLEAALKSRLAVYPIVLGLEDTETLENLRTLATETGGRFFAIDRVEQLDRVYRRIEEELRSQYVLVYEPPPRTVRGELRRVRVEMARPGLRARTLSAYYP